MRIKRCAKACADELFLASFNWSNWDQINIFYTGRYALTWLMFVFKKHAMCINFQKKGRKVIIHPIV